MIHIKKRNRPLSSFDFLTKEPDFENFVSTAVTAEKLLHVDVDSCVLGCRRAMEFAVKWMYAVDKALETPYQDNLVSLMSTDEFRDIVDGGLLRRMDYIRKLGNAAAHGGRRITTEQAALCLENLYIFLDFVAYCYAGDYTERPFDRSLLETTPSVSSADSSLKEGAEKALRENEARLEALLAENAALRDELSARRAEQQQSYVPKPLDISEYKTRKLYIDTMLLDAGWIEGKNWLNEYELPGMPNKSEVGYADYVLLGDDGKILAVIEAKRTCADAAKGRQQAKLYADLIERKQGRRPVVFLTNGFETRIVDNQYPERRVAAIWSKRDLEKLFNLQAMRGSLKYVVVDKNIAGRW